MTPEEFMEVSDSLDGLVAIMSGYKNKLEEAGFSEYASEVMVMEFHALQMHRQLHG